MRLIDRRTREVASQPYARLYDCHSRLVNGYHAICSGCEAVGPGTMVPNSSEEIVPDSSSPALSMSAAPLSLRTSEKPLENADRGAGWRPPIIESAGGPR
jgi:hypothetical protein